MSNHPVTVKNKKNPNPRVNLKRITVRFIEQCRIEAARQLGQPIKTCVVFEVSDGIHKELVYTVVTSNRIQDISVKYKVNSYYKHDPEILCLRLKLFIETVILVQKPREKNLVIEKVVVEKRMKIRLSHVFPSHILLGYKFTRDEFTSEIQQNLEERGYDVEHHNLVRLVCCDGVWVDSDLLPEIDSQVEEESIKHPQCLHCGKPFPTV